MQSQNTSLTDEQIHTLALSDWLNVLRKLFDAFEKKPTSELVDAYRDALSDVPLGLLEVAINQAINTCKFFPRVSELRKLIDDELKASGSNGDIAYWLTHTYLPMLYL